MTLSLPSTPPPKRGTCARCGKLLAIHRSQPWDTCGDYLSAIAKPPTMIPAGLVAIVDTAEPNLDNPNDASDRALARARLPWIHNPTTREREALPFVRGSLNAGDYSALGCTGRILIEYKTPDDLASTLFGKHRLASGEWAENFPRFCEVLQLMASTAKRAAIVVPCSIEDIKRRNYVSEANPLSVLGRVNRIFLAYGIPTIWAGDEAEAARQMGNLLKAAWEDEAAARRERAAQGMRAT